MLEKGDEPVPGYRLEAFLGRGQFGEVWRATSPGGAQVALKFLNLDERQGLKELRAIQRFKTIRYPHLATVTALWLLDDDGNVVDSSSMGSELPQPTGRDTLWPEPQAEPDRTPHRLVVATLLCDKNLMDRLAECQAQGSSGIPVDELLRYMEEAAKAIDFLNAQCHDLGDGPVAIQHCDIKPANIMLTGGSVMICDFGVAAFLGNPRIAATATSMAGSPAYMSPECTQCKPSSASDQYSLAITYVELRTGKLPFRSQTWTDVIDAHRSGSLDLSILPSNERSAVRKATSVNPKDRYPSAEAFVRALQQSVAMGDGAKPAVRFFRRLAGATAGAALVAALSWGAFTYIPVRDREEPLHGNALSVASDVSARFQVLPPDAEVAVDGQSVAVDVDGHVSLTGAAETRLDIAVRKPPEYLETRKQLTLAELKSQTHVFQLERDPEYLHQLAQQHAARAFEIIDADEPHLPGLEQAAAEYQQALRSDRSRFAVVPPVSRMLNDPEQDYSFTIRCLAIHSEKPWLVARLRGTQLALWNLSDLNAPPTVLHEHSSHVCNVLTAGSYAASADLMGQINLTRLDENGRPLETLAPAGLTGLEMAISPDLRWFIAGEYEGQVVAWKLDASDADAAPVLIGRHTQSVRGIVVTPDSQRVITAGGEDGAVCQWSLPTPNPTATDAQLGTQPGDVAALAMSPDGRWIAFGGEAQTELEFPISCIDLPQGTVQVLPQGHTAPVSALAYDWFRSQDPKQSGSALLASGSEDGQIHIYGMEATRLLDSDHPAAIRSLTFCPSPGWLVSGSEDGRVRVWDLLHGDQKPLVLRGNASRIVQVLATPEWLIVGYANGAILLWDIRRCFLVKRAANDEHIELHDPADGTDAIRA